MPATPKRGCADARRQRAEPRSSGQRPRPSACAQPRRAPLFTGRRPSSRAAAACRRSNAPSIPASDSTRSANCSITSSLRSGHSTSASRRAVRPSPRPSSSPAARRAAGWRSSWENGWLKLRIGETAPVMRRGEGEKRRHTACELIERRTHPPENRTRRRGLRGDRRTRSTGAGRRVLVGDAGQLGLGVVVGVGGDTHRRRLLGIGGHPAGRVVSLLHGEERYPLPSAAPTRDCGGRAPAVRMFQPWPSPDDAGPRAARRPEVT